MKDSLNIVNPNSSLDMVKLTYREAVVNFIMSGAISNRKICREWVNTISNVYNIPKKQVRKDCGIINS
ncbi:hypothetical protein DDN37_03045 [Vibrio cholerae]|nr:hypothetical protein [Vibrio cholerae]EGR3953507.1 hypothetical protein [Vibrio cholerae]EGR3989105.1 hypothetical protein [Vibrio cholerae]EGR4356178.1 hypothetical protein [Vibrio cholerae]KFD99670.1 hypothetical protein DN34_729 [Vibrio cholerae]